MKKRMKKTISLLSFFLFWQLAAMLIGRKIFPTPIDVFLSFIQNWQPLLTHCLYSLVRLIAGVVAALIVGTPIGILMGYSKKLDDFFSPLINILSPIPKIALLPLIMLLFGIGNLSKIFIIFIIMVFQVIVATRDSVKKIPEEYFIPFYTVKAQNRYIILNIVFPALLPALFTSLRIGLATSISVLFFAETFGTKWGLGFYILDMWMRLDYRQMYLGILMLGFIGLITVAAVDFAEQKLCPWNQKLSGAGE